MFQTPILFLIYNRPEKTSLVFDVIKQIKPKYLYVAADGPNSSKSLDMEKCSLTRDIVTNNIDWDCELKILFNSTNLGCGLSVSNSISWFFKNVEQGIILEDDCLPHISFFPYCEILLNLHRNNNEITSIAGTALPNGIYSTSHSYIFCQYCLIWGWATWRRAWDTYDFNMSTWPILKNTNFLKKISMGRARFVWQWHNNFQKVWSKEIDTWDYQWTYGNFLRGGKCIVPVNNLINNIGFDEEGTHTKHEHPLFSYSILQEMHFPLCHPNVLNLNLEADRYLTDNWMGVNRIEFYKIVLFQSYLLKVLVKAKRYFRKWYINLIAAK